MSFRGFATRKQQKPRIEAGSREHRGPAPARPGDSSSRAGPRWGQSGGESPPPHTWFALPKAGCADLSPPKLGTPAHCPWGPPLLGVPPLLWAMPRSTKQAGRWGDIYISNIYI